jgi:hypothetical protein
MQLQRSLSDLAIGVNSEAFRTTWSYRFTGLMFRGRLKPLLDECLFATIEP